MFLGGLLQPEVAYSTIVNVAMVLAWLFLANKEDHLGRRSWWENTRKLEEQTWPCSGTARPSAKDFVLHHLAAGHSLEAEASEREPELSMRAACAGAGGSP